MKKKGLGRGLEALLGVSSGSAEGIREAPIPIPIDQIFPNPYQPRQDFGEEELNQLTDSIRQYGLLQPILVRPRDGHYELVAGERRLRAAKRAGLKEIPAVIRDCTDSEVLALALIENLQREGLNPLEEAKAYKALSDQFGWTQERIALQVGKARPTVTNKLRLLELPAAVQEALRKGTLSEGHALALLTALDEGVLLEAFQQVVSKGLTVRQTLALVKRLSRPPKSASLPSKPEWRTLERLLEERLQSVVRIRKTRSGGVLEIHFSSEQELDGIVRQFLDSDRREDL
ncbi:MAG: ParB/RepB/Spo0J family partition protein [Armatimonadetes bacterium]|nr:ParB/RepB/Spo0J family partition protein [Armatimonadota bacterium]MDW8122973.1 ParB/RepB/Spo0J family partition protein [Armatimonadota bacterium]